jgi:hypothetical protein
VLIFWLSNTSRLLYYLKKDETLEFAGTDLQDELTKLLHLIYDTTANTFRTLLANGIDSSLLSHDPIGVSDIKFERRAITSFFISDVPATEMFVPEDISLHTPADTLEKFTPSTIKNMFTSYVFLLRLYGLHPSLIHQLMTQAFHHLSTMVFSQILLRRTLCSRSAALCIRMNLTSLEEWIHVNADAIPTYDPQHTASSFLNQLQPVIQLLQFLQVLSSLRTLAAFLECFKGNGLVNILNWEQVRRILSVYRYERGEEYVPDEVVMYVRMCADEISKRVRERIKQEEAQKKRRGSIGSEGSGSGGSAYSDDDAASLPSSDDAVSVKSFNTVPANPQQYRPHVVARALTHRPRGKFSSAISESMLPIQEEALSSILIFPDQSKLLSLTLPLTWETFSDGRGGLIQANEIKGMYHQNVTFFALFNFYVLGDESKSFNLIPSVPEEYLVKLDKVKFYQSG